MSDFAQLGVNDTLRRAIDEMGFVAPMPVQEAVIPHLLSSETTPSSNRDIIALAQTGTGKTAAFGLPLLQNLDISGRTVQAVVMSPTRELCLQISDDLKDFGKYVEGLRVTAVYGGAPIDSQIRSCVKAHTSSLPRPADLSIL